MTDRDLWSEPWVDHELEGNLSSWLTETDLTPDEATTGLDRLLDEFPVTPQTRRRFLGRWLERDEGAGRRTGVHDHPANTNRRARLMFSATGITAALAILAITINLVDTDPAPLNAGAATLVVASDGAGQYDTIQAAVDAATDGDTISIQPGTYDESVTVAKDLTIAGDPTDGGAVVIVAPPGPTDPEIDEIDRPHALLLSASVVTISDLTIEVSAGATGIGATGGSPLIERVAIVPIESEDPVSPTPWYDPWIALGFYGQTSPTIRDSRIEAYTAVRDGAEATFEDNTISGLGYLSIDGPGESIVRRNTFVDGAAVNTSGAIATIEDNDFAGGRVAMDSQSVVEVRGNTFRDVVGANFDEAAIAVRDVGSHATIEGNTVSSADSGISVTGGAGADVRGNQLAASKTGITVGDSGDVLINHNTIEGDGAGIVLISGAEPTITGNTIDVSGRAIAIAGASPSSIDGNVICGGDGSIVYVSDQVPPELGENEIC